MYRAVGTCTSAPPVRTHVPAQGVFFDAFFVVSSLNSIAQYRSRLVFEQDHPVRARKVRSTKLCTTVTTTSTATMQGLAPKTIKYLMFAFNLLFVITGIVLLSIGVVIHAVYHEYQHFLDNSFFSVPSLLIAIGSVIFFIAFFGCCGAIRESHCMIITFCTLLVAIFILEIIGGTMGYVMRSQVATVTKNKMMDTMSKYNNSNEIQLVWDNLQRDFNCCGTNNATDWTNLNKSLPGIPMSCCTEVVGAIGSTNCTLESPKLHKKGCIDAFMYFADEHAAKIAGVGLSLGAIQLIGIFLSSYLAKSIRNSYQTM